LCIGSPNRQACNVNVMIHRVITVGPIDTVLCYTWCTGTSQMCVCVCVVTVCCGSWWVIEGSSRWKCDTLSWHRTPGQVSLYECTLRLPLLLGNLSLDLTGGGESSFAPLTLKYICILSLANSAVYPHGSISCNRVAATSQWWRRLVNAYEVKVGMVYLPGKSCVIHTWSYVIHTWSLQGWGSNDGAPYVSLYLYL